MEELKNVIYKSSATLKDVDLNVILDVARNHNPTADITGVLVTHTHGFIQYIEGPESNIDALYERIKKDPRHHDVITLFVDEVSERRYKNWSMGYICLSNKSTIESLTGSNFSHSLFYDVVSNLLPLEYKTPSEA